MFGTLSQETEVNVPASKAWALYGSLELGKVVAGKIFEAVDVVEGAGGTGLGFKYYTEKFTKVDNENMIKETEAVEGGFLDIGFSLYSVRCEIKEKPDDDMGSSCLVKCTIEYEVKDEFAANVSLVTMDPFVALMSIANEHLMKSN
ncbi:norbelladine synthase-like isoform X2 [Rutidosis leptorrhynchoides]|uniref:norbelladine synthase-like isoform X2 n=1 Tax=Rutidosis leptorrhynchoides TaxID=125765 RepID=UPI003A99E589